MAELVNDSVTATVVSVSEVARAEPAALEALHVFSLGDIWQKETTTDLYVGAARLGTPSVSTPRRSGTSDWSAKKTEGNYRALLALRNQVSELKAQLAVASTSGQDPNSYDQGIPSLPKDAAVEVSEAGSLDTNPESAADILATGAFDRLPAAEIGSNHALFRSMTAFVTKLGARDSHLFQENPVAERSGPSLQVPASGPGDSARRGGEEGFPNAQTCIEWIARFFDTVGAVLPYISEAPLLREANRMGTRIWTDSPHSRSTKALLYIVFAHALSTWNLETALLLVGSYQQNSQRAMPSLTTHVLAVKASYQLGLHSPSTYDGLGIQEKELRAKVWFAVVIQDRILSAALGRPCLIPPHYVQVEIPDSISPSKYAAGTVTISLHQIVGITLETVYSANIGSTQMQPRDLTLKAVELLDQLEQWRDHNAHFVILSSKSDLASWSADMFQPESHVILLSLFYHRTIMLVSTPVLMAVLEQVINPTSGGDLSALTMCWHGLGLWLICMRSASLPPAIGIISSDVELFMVEGLETLKSVGGSSIMTGKAHRFLQRIIHLLKTMGLNPGEQQGLLESGGSPLTKEALPQDNFLDFMFGSVDDLFCQLGDNDFLGTELLSMDQDVNTYDASGFL
ncbi:hypothetical protein G7Z17_g2898 [Cylindrodendrum hubeiense]|uniref:Xylanolytic transcriptional activator regulatory domain-containing protein n=1 Tax=Cylindrodendrum hubeiense TaxID=595255 RepID=A0A9P5HBX9_9HYPO|nr:hypothetical protein G7Z17_g2898 [Cylindrodendrum hubeiense]